MLCRLDRAIGIVDQPGRLCDVVCVVMRGTTCVVIQRIGQGGLRNLQTLLKRI